MNDLISNSPGDYDKLIYMLMFDIMQNVGWIS